MARLSRHHHLNRVLNLRILTDAYIQRCRISALAQAFCDLRGVMRPTLCAMPKLQNISFAGRVGEEVGGAALSDFGGSQQRERGSVPGIYPRDQFTDIN